MGKTRTQALAKTQNMTPASHSPAVAHGPIFFLGPPVNTGASVPRACIKCVMLLTGRAHICSHISWHLEMPGSLPILTLHLCCPGCQFIPLENMHMGIRGRTVGHGNTLQETEKCGFLPVTEETLLDTREKGNPVVGSSLYLSAYGKTLNPTTHLPQDTHLPA